MAQISGEKLIIFNPLYETLSVFSFFWEVVQCDNDTLVETALPERLQSKDSIRALPPYSVKT